MQIECIIYIQELKMSSLVKQSQKYIKLVTTFTGSDPFQIFAHMQLEIISQPDLKL